MNRVRLLRLCSALASELENCVQCHELSSLHGVGSERGRPPACHDCHTKHAILPPTSPASSIHPRSLKHTCAQCHPREACGGEVSLLTLGALIAEKGLRHCFAMGADRMIRIDDSSWEGRDAWTTALVLSAAIRKIGQDVVVCGKQDRAISKIYYII